MHCPLTSSTPMDVVRILSRSPLSKHTVFQAFANLWVFSHSMFRCFWWYFLCIGPYGQFAGNFYVNTLPADRTTQDIVKAAHHIHAHGQNAKKKLLLSNYSYFPNIIRTSRKSTPLFRRIPESPNPQIQSRQPDCIVSRLRPCTQTVQRHFFSCLLWL